MMLGITEQFRDKWVLLQISGEIDMATGPELRQRIVQYVQEGHLHIILDLAKVDFIDSTGLGVLIGGLKRTRSHGGDLQCIGLSESLKEMFKLTGLDAVLTEKDV
ncbi:MAG: anti-sigma B factor antagonist [Actinobacteria bacterium]|nr:anti-sigma B factor antagonist [Actinomycetota bacterium]MBD30474.1 anti-sigma B factor antagonist [Acidimicrobiaceae bacterium]|tara:strand:- start:12261 stop:12575 length:315 start_codon:yes stop_codon:yes gene_type:complete